MTGETDIPLLLDVRDEVAFLAAHALNAAHIPCEQLCARMHELPEKGSAIHVFDTDPDRAAQAVNLLRDRGYDASAVTLSDAQLTHAGPARIHLWHPSPFLIEAIDRIRREGR